MTRVSHWLFCALFLCSCSILSYPSTPPIPPVVPTDTAIVDPLPLPPCDVDGSRIQVFNVAQDGRDIGREVRTSWDHNGPFGAERITVSHLLRRFKKDVIELDRATIVSQRTLKDADTLLRMAFVTVDETSTWLSLVGFNGSQWERVHEEKDSVREAIRSVPRELTLRENDTIGFDLNDRMRNIAMNKKPAEKGLHFYVARMQTSLPLDIWPPEPATLTWQGIKVTGRRVTAVHADTDRVWLSIFVSDAGIILEEIYPQLHQIRTLTPGAPTVPSQAANPFVGLYSNTYLALPEISTKNRYEIISDQPIKFDEISFIGDPANHTLTPIDDRTFSLSVQAGGTDGTSPPSQRDLDSNMYIETSSPLITAALAYLKSAGAEGNLPPHRRENALVVISGISRLTARRAIWKSPDETARWIMRYVYAILPDKQHTHTMKTATQALLEGQGDCTEHSVLFAALMRAAGVPTRLVSGIYLARGGAWVYHMWNEYWDGSRWQSIDTAVGPFFRTGAHYIALGPGVSDFADHRSKIAFFLDTAFSGFSINLVEATADGQILHLVQPTRQHIAFSDKTVFMATTALKRGKPDRALEIVEKNYPARHPPLRLQILRADLLFQNGRHEEALQMIHALRQITSLPVNVVFLDMLEYRVLLTLKQFKAADAIHASLCPPPGDHNPYCTVMHARGLEAEGRFDDALAAIDQSLAEHEDSVELRIALLSLLANPAGNFSAEELARGEAIGDALLFDTHYADTEALIHMTRLLFRAGRLQAGIPWLFHSLLLSPGDPTLRRLRDIATGQCPSLHETPPLF